MGFLVGSRHAQGTIDQVKYVPGDLGRDPCEALEFDVLNEFEYSQGC